MEKELESTTGKSSFFAIINKKGAVQWTVYNNGKGYIGIYCGDEGETAAFKEDEAPNYALFLRQIFGKNLILEMKTMSIEQKRWFMPVWEIKVMFLPDRS